MIPTKSTYQYLMVPTTVPLFNYMTSVSDFYATIWTRARHLQRLSMRQPKKTVTVRKWEPWTSFAICIVSPWLLTLAHFLVWILSPISMMTNRIRLSRHISAEPLPFSKKKKTQLHNMIQDQDLRNRNNNGVKLFLSLEWPLKSERPPSLIRKRRKVTKAPGKRAATPPQDQQDTRCFPLQVEMHARHCDRVKDSS